MRTLALALIFSTAPIWAQQSKKVGAPIPSQFTAARYQLVAATVESGSMEEKTAFILDTQTGDVWIYQPAFSYTETDGTKKTVPAAFVPVPKWPQKKQ